MKNSKAKALKILVVEDEPTICRICSRTLTMEGFEVSIAANGSIAEKMLGEKEYDLIITDVKMPEMDGKQLYRAIEEKHPDMVGRIIFTTGDTLSIETRHFLEETKRVLLPKPFTPDELKTAVKEALGRVGK